MAVYPTLIVHNAKIHTGVAHRPEVQALAVSGNRIAAVGTNCQIRALAGPATIVIDAGRRRVIPGLIDACLPLIATGLGYNQQLRWDGIPTLDEALRVLAEQVRRTPAPQWVSVIGGFCEHQFAERRLPTLDELDRIAPSTPVYIQHLQDRALLNGAAMAACGYDASTLDPPGGHIEWDAAGAPTGLLIAAPSTEVFQQTLAHAPELPHEYQINSTRQFMRELNRLGITSVIDPGSPQLRYPGDYATVEELAQHHLLSVRVAYHLAAQTPGAEIADYLHWSTIHRPRDGDDAFRFNGAGSVLVHAAQDYTHFRQPPSPIPAQAAADLEDVISRLVARNWPWRMHASYDETIGMALDVLERIDAKLPLQSVPWFIDGAETIDDHQIARMVRLGGGICVQPNMAYQGEYFIERHGDHAAARTPPLRHMLDAGLRIGVGSGGTERSSMDPWVTLSWLVTGCTLGGVALYPPEQRLDRATALALHTRANTWFSGEDGRKGQIDIGQLADFAVLTQDYFDVADEDIRHIRATLTVMDGRIVFADADYHSLDLPPPAPLPVWSALHHGHGVWRPPACGHAEQRTAPSSRGALS
ncbi:MULTISPECIES: amidohydrolase [unclassified Dyella]|uniref:amidohydrolase n=1 Tax=unclassified Dyella TaxID=2634549 RepID=UPI000C82DE9C|nr:MULTISPECIES: amidohydrolase [unclassified Dyella]MDR3446836.1 amidohydrolase [Dyella sp.]PMQ03127.1 N-substituted formamide deformylase [Dyella sp. AD56]